MENRGLLGITFLLLSAAGHFGGSLTHGKDYLTAYLPELLGGKKKVIVDTGTVDDAAIFAGVIQPIFDSKCVECHNTEKSNGSLMMHDFANLMAGGKSGAALTIDSAEDSLLIQRALRPLEDEKHMPPEGKPQLTAAELETLSWWIDQGAKERKPIETLPTSDAAIAELEKRLGFPIAPETLEFLPWTEVVAHIESIDLPKTVRVGRISQDQPAIYVVIQQSSGTPLSLLESLLPARANITSLSLTRTSISDEELSTIAEFTNLEELHLAETEVSAQGVANLTPLRNLEELNLFSTEVCDEVFSTLTELPNLSMVVLSETKVTKEAKEKFILAAANPAEGNKIRSKIAELEAELNALQIDVIGGSSPATAPEEETEGKPPETEKQQTPKD